METYVGDMSMDRPEITSSICSNKRDVTGNILHCMDHKSVIVTAKESVPFFTRFLDKHKDFPPKIV